MRTIPLLTTETKRIELGLALVRILIEVIGGIIEVDRDGVPGEGRAFILKCH